MTASAPTSLYGLLERHLRAGRDRPLLVTPDATYTSGDVDRESARVAAFVRAAGLASGDRVVIDLKNGVDAVAALFGVSRAGGVVVGASPQWTPRQLGHVVENSGARILVTTELRASQLGQGRPLHVLARGARAGATPWESLVDEWHGDVPSEPALLIYTSGTTGAPKGVAHPHKNVVDFARIVAGYLENTADDRLLWLLAWSFGYGLSQLVTMCWSGGSLIVPSSVLPADVVKAHDRFAATGIALVPYGWSQLVDYLESKGRRLEGVRYATNAGDGPSPALLDRLPRALPGARIFLMYGQTECFRTTFLPPHLYDVKRGAMGYPIPEVVTAVVDERGALAGEGEHGELLHGGALLASGYFEDEAATALKFRRREEPALRAIFGDAPVLHTGDIVRKDADGCLYYVGRSETVIKSAGFRFSPVEIEEALRSAEGVTDAAAFGVDDAELGQVVEALVVASSHDAAAILNACRARLPRYMIPRRIHFVGAIPRSPNGKIRRGELAAAAK